MEKFKCLLVVLLMCLSASAGYGEGPTSVNLVPTRYIFVDDDSHCEDGYKFDTRTGRLWEYKDHWNPEKAKINDYTGIDYPSESESYDGRFTFKSLSNNGHSWFYVFDTKTGNFWTCKYREYAFHLLK